MTFQELTRQDTGSDLVLTKADRLKDLSHRIGVRWPQTQR